MVDTGTNGIITDQASILTAFYCSVQKWNIGEFCSMTISKIQAQIFQNEISTSLNGETVFSIQFVKCFMFENELMHQVEHFKDS